MSNKPNIHDVLENACEKFGLTIAEALAIMKTPLHPHGLRDEFAGKAMQGLMAQPSAHEWIEEGIAEAAYRQADAMLKARNA